MLVFILDICNLTIEEENYLIFKIFLDRRSAQAAFWVFFPLMFSHANTVYLSN